MKLIKLIFVTLFLIFYQTLLSAELQTNNGTGISIKCDTARYNQEECLNKFQKRLVLAKLMQDNYDPNMLRMLKINVYAGQVIDQIDQLEGLTELQKEIHKNIASFSNKLNSEYASIKTDEIPDYILSIIGQTLEETAEHASNVAQKIPTTPNIKANAIKKIVEMAPQIIEFSKKAYTEFPKIKVGNVDAAISKEENMAELFELITAIEEGHSFGQISPEAFKEVNVAFATFFGETINISDDKIERSESAQALKAVSELLKYSDESISLDLKAAKDQIIKHTTESMKNTEQNLSLKSDQIKSQNKKLLIEQKNTQQKVDEVLDGISDLKVGQEHMIEGIDYLTHTQLSKDFSENISGKNSDELSEFINKIEESIDGKSISEHCRMNSNNITLKQKKCAVETSGLSKAKALLKQVIYKEKMQLANNTVSVISDLGNIFGDENLSKAANEAGKLISTATKVNSAIDSFSKLNQAADLLTLSNMVGFMTGVGAITSAISLFSGMGGGGKAAMHQQIMSELLNIRKSIQNLHEDMLDQFEKTQSQIQELGSGLHYSMNLNGVILSNQIAFQSELIAKNHEEIIRELKNLRGVNLNIQRLFSKETIREFQVTRKDYLGTKDQKLLSENFRTIISRYSTAIEDLVPEVDQIFPIENHIITQNSLIDAKDMILLTKVNKLGARGKYLLLNLALNLINKVEKIEGCGEDFTHNLLYANLISHDLISIIDSSYEDNNDKIYRLDLVLNDKDGIDHKFLSSELKRSIAILNKLQDRAKKCIGIGDQRESSNIIFIKNLSKYYYDNFLSYLNSIQEQLRESKSTIRQTILKQIKKDVNYTIGPKDIFNGLSTELKDGINDNLAYEILTEKELEDRDIAYKSFIKRPRKKISRCFPSPKKKTYLYDNHINELDFPKETINHILNDPYLKVAVGTGLIRWTWCFEVGAYDMKRKEKPIFLVAIDKIDLSKRKKNINIWKITIPITKKLSTKIDKYKKTITHWRRLEGAVANKKHSVANPITSKTIRIVSECNESYNEEKGSYYVAIPGEQILYPNILDEVNMPQRKKTVNGVIATTTVKCEKFGNILKDLWSSHFVNSAQAWNYTINKNKEACKTLDKSGFVKKCIPKKPVSMDPKKYKDELNKFFEKKQDFKIGRLEYFSSVMVDTPEYIKNYKTSVKHGVRHFYLTLKLAMENCEGAALKGLNSCSPISGSIQLPHGRSKLESLAVASDMLVHLPLTYYIAKDTSDKNSDKLNKQLSFILSPNAIFNTAETYNRVNRNGDSLIKSSKMILNQNRKHYTENVMPLLSEKYEFDTSILVHEQIFHELNYLIRKINQAN